MATTTVKKNYETPLRNLVSALDRMYGRTTLSLNVREALAIARHEITTPPTERDPADESGDPK